MAHDLTVNTTRSNLNASLVASLKQPYTPSGFPQIAFGETASANLYLTEGDAYSANSGDATYTPRITLTLADQKPQGGTFTLSDGLNDFLVSGAGSTDANGLYLQINATYNNNAVWKHVGESATYFIRRETHDENNTWHIVEATTYDQTPANQYLYSDGHAGSGPDENNWSVDVDGVAPAPTLASTTETTSALDWDATATEIETALNELNSDSGPFGDFVKVTKYTNGAFYIKFNSVGAQSNLIVDATGIDPVSSASVLAIVDGDTNNRNQQLVQIKADALIDANGGTPIASGWNMTLDATGAKLAAALAGGAISANYSIQVTAPDESVDVVATGPVAIKPALT